MITRNEKTVFTFTLTCDRCGEQLELGQWESEEQALGGFLEGWYTTFNRKAGGIFSLSYQCYEKIYDEEAHAEFLISRLGKEACEGNDLIDGGAD